MAKSNAEFSLIDWIRRHANTNFNGVECGIGDDAAVARFNGSAVLATDMLMEGTHFRFPDATPQQAGRKALAVNLSDLAAMAATPRYALVSVAFPQQRGRQFAEDVMSGVIKLADEFNVTVIGGDTNSWDGPLVINVAVAGESSTPPIYRSGALAGDWVMATGAFGGSLSGHHLDFQPRVTQAIALNNAVQLHSMIDVSDGLAADLHHILDESKVGVVIDANAIPVSKAAAETENPIHRALGDGEDFELLFTVSPTDGQRLISNSPVDIPITHIGEVVSDGSRKLHLDGRTIELPRSGWEHSL